MPLNLWFGNVTFVCTLDLSSFMNALKDIRQLHPPATRTINRIFNEYNKTDNTSDSWKHARCHKTSIAKLNKLYDKRLMRLSFLFLDMAVNSSTCSDSHLDPNHSSINSHSQQFEFTDCLMSRPSSFVFTSYSIVIIVILLPLCSLILSHGLQQWWQKCSTSSFIMSHSDSITYHMVTMELFSVLGCILSCCAIYNNQSIILQIALVFLSFTSFGQTSFHVLSFVERYLAVIHPVTYLKLKKQRGIRIRNIIIGCVWVFCFVIACLMLIEDLFNILFLSFLILTLAIISFFTSSVLCVLIRPSPGVQVRNTERVDQSKQKAFYTIVAIFGVLVFRFLGCLTWTFLHFSGKINNCVMMTCTIWFNLPCTLVLPLLFAYRTGKSLCCNVNTKWSKGYRLRPPQKSNLNKRKSSEKDQ